VAVNFRDLVSIEGVRLAVAASERLLDTVILSPHLHGLASLQGPRLPMPQRGLVFVLEDSDLEELWAAEPLLARFNALLPAVVLLEAAGGAVQRVQQECSSADLLVCTASEPLKVVAARLAQRLFAAGRRLVSIHAVMLRLQGRGVVILGSSGSGKTDVALELISRGHQLVADDGVEIYCPCPGSVWGRSPLPEGGNRLAVYGIGIIAADQLYGENAVAAEAPICLAVDLVDNETYRDPLEEQGQLFYLMGVGVPYVALNPARSANLATLVELAMRVRGREFRRSGELAGQHSEVSGVGDSRRGSGQ